MKNNDIINIINRIRNNDDNTLSITWVGKNYSKLDLIHDLEKLQIESNFSSYEEACDFIEASINEIKRNLEKRIAEMYPGFPSAVTSSFDDDNCFIVNIFNVPEEMWDEIREKIADLERELFREKPFAILVSLKNPEVTKEYYPNSFFQNRNSKM